MLSFIFDKTHMHAPYFYVALLKVISTPDMNKSHQRFHVESQRLARRLFERLHVSPVPSGSTCTFFTVPFSTIIANLQGKKHKSRNMKTVSLFYV